MKRSIAHLLGIHENCEPTKCKTAARAANEAESNHRMMVHHLERLANLDGVCEECGGDAPDLHYISCPLIQAFKDGMTWVNQDGQWILR